MGGDELLRQKAQEADDRVGVKLFSNRSLHGLARLPMPRSSIDFCGSIRSMMRFLSRPRRSRANLVTKVYEADPTDEFNRQLACYPE